MKFSKSERQIHNHNFNPPCNVYQPDHLLNKNKILTGSLAVPSIINRNTFGYQSRFDRLKNSGPGPGSYIQQQKFMSQPKTYNQSLKNKIKKVSHFNNTNTPPSIPFNYYGQDKNDLQQQNYIKNLLMNQNIQNATKNIKKNNPTFSFGKSEKTHTYIPRTQTIQNKQPIDKALVFEKQQDKNNDEADKQKKRTNLVWYEKIKRANERRIQVIQSIDPQFVPSLQLIQLVKNKKNKPNPGPGDYQIQNVTPEFQNFYNPKGVSFTNLRRFSIDKQSLLGPGLYNPKLNQKSNKFSFGKSQRNLFQPKEEGNFRFYISPDPQNLKQQIWKNRQRVTSCPFGSNSTRFSQKINDQGPSLTLDQERKRIANQKLNKMIRTRIKIHQKLVTTSQKQQGLLGISTMASTIQ